MKLSASFRHNKPVYIWTQSEVSRWLKQNIPNCQAVYCHMFANHDITGCFILYFDLYDFIRLFNSTKVLDSFINIMFYILPLQYKLYF